MDALAVLLKHDLTMPVTFKMGLRVFGVYCIVISQGAETAARIPYVQYSRHVVFTAEIGVKLDAVYKESIRGTVQETLLQAAGHWRRISWRPTMQARIRKRSWADDTDLPRTTSEKTT